MIDKDHLTTREKIMHAEKVGIVSRVHNIEKNPVMHCNSYTLCAVRKAETPECFAKRLASPNESLVRFCL